MQLLLHLSFLHQSLWYYVTIYSLKITAYVILHIFLSNASWTASGSVQPHHSITSPRSDHLLAGLPQGQSPSIIPLFTGHSSFHPAHVLTFLCFIKSAIVSVSSCLPTFSLVILSFQVPTYFQYSPTTSGVVHKGRPQRGGGRVCSDVYTCRQDCMQTSATQLRTKACHAGMCSCMAILITPTVTALAVLNGPLRLLDVYCL